MANTQGRQVMQGQGSSAKSRVWVAPDLLEALAAGKTFEQWLNGRVPIASKARISSDKKKDAHGVAAQHGGNRRGADRHNLAIVKFYEDNDKSADKPGVVRPAFEMLVSELAARRTAEGFPIQGVACLERERIYRRAGDWERLTDALKVDRNGVLYESGIRRDRFIDIYGDTAEIEGLQGVAVAKREVRKTSERMVDAHMERRVLGISTGGPRRFGYLGPDVRKGRRSNEKKNREEWPHLKWLIREGAAGRAWQSIAEELNARGVRTAKGGLWKSTTVRDVAANPLNYGLRMVDGSLFRDENGEPVIGKWDRAGKLKHFQAICERIRLARAQKGLPVEGGVDFSPGSASDRTRKYLFSGFLRCGRVLEHGDTCDEKWSGNPGHPGERWKYTCRKRGNGKGCGCGRDGERVNAHLTELVLRQYEKLEARRLATVPTSWDKAEELKEARAEVTELRARWRAKQCDKQFFWEEFPRLEADVKRLEAEERKFAKREQTRATTQKGTVRQRWKSMDLAQKRATVAEVLVAVIVLPLPEGAAKSGPFDPDLLIPVWRAASTDGRDGADSGADRTDGAPASADAANAA